MKQKHILGLALVFILCASGAYVFLGGQGTDGDDVVASESYRTMKVLEIEGDAILEREDIGEINIYSGMQLLGGDLITVGEGSYLRLVLDDNKYIYVDENTVLSLEASGDTNDSQTTIVVEIGTIINELTESLSEDSSYEVTTPNASMSVRGTVYGVEVYEVDGIILTDLSVFEGKVSSQLIMTDGSLEQEVFVDKGFAVTIESDKETYCEYVLGEIGKDPKNEIDLTQVTNNLLLLLEKVAGETEKDIQFDQTEVKDEIERRNTTDDDSTTLEESEVITNPSTNSSTVGESTTDDDTSSDVDSGTSIQSYTLTLVNQGVSSAFLYQENSTLSISNPTRTGYSFVGWYDEDYSQEVDVTVMPSSDLTAYALWQAETYKVTTDGTIQLVKYNEQAKEPTVSSIEGYTFIGWYAGDELYDFSTPVTSNVTLESLWSANKYELTCDVDGVQTKYVYTTYQKLDLPIPVKDGYDFVGWYDIDGKQYTTMPTSDLVLYALFDEADYVVTFYDGESVYDEVSVTYATSISNNISSVDTSKDDYVFIGWYTDSTFTQKLSSLEVMDSSDLSLYGLWEEVYTLTYTVNGISYTKELVAGEDALLAFEDDTVVNGQLSRHIGWYDVNDTSTVLTSIVMPDSDYEVKAAWTNLYSITFKYNDGTTLTGDVYESYYFIEGESLTLLPVLSDSGFTGWYDTNDNRWMVGETMPDSDLVLYANITTATYPVKMMNGETVIDILYLNEGDNISAALSSYNLSRTGYIFDGWYLDKEFNEELSSEKLKEANVELYVYSKWIEKQYVIQYVTEDTVVKDTTTYSYSDSVTLESGLFSNGYFKLIWKNEATGSTYYIGKTVDISELATGAVEQNDGTWLITLTPAWHIKI